jgi:hypothetical protein
MLPMSFRPTSSTTSPKSASFTRGPPPRPRRGALHTPWTSLREPASSGDGSTCSGHANLPRCPDRYPPAPPPSTRL